jgi:mono/diheme cytochrome c family protein
MGLPLVSIFTAAWFAFAALQGAAPADGVYSSAQAERGKIVVASHCASCHADDLSGLEGPALVGNSFMVKWEPRDLAMLFKDVRDTMPAGAVTSVTDEEKLDAVAYLLQANGFKAGDAELTPNLEALARIPLARSAGPVILQTGSLVKVTGCLTQGAANAWMLTSAGEPRSAAASPSQQKPEAVSGSDRTVQLLNVFPNPSAHKGHTMEASGLLVRDSTGVSVNVLSLEMLSPGCSSAPPSATPSR